MTSRRLTMFGCRRFFMMAISLLISFVTFMFHL
jgi:hypothetical protein